VVLSAMNKQRLWQQLVSIKPSLPHHVHIQPRYYNDELWYVLEDKAGGKFHRFNNLAYQLLGFMNGRNSLEQILGQASQACLKQTLDDVPTREDLIELLQYLYVADLLVCDFPPQTAEVFKRRQLRKQRFWHQLIKSPYAWKLPLFNPNPLLQNLKPLAHILASKWTGIAWLLCVIYGLFLAASHWNDITATELREILSPRNLFLLWLTYPLLKAVHELGHGLFTTAWGGSVREFGVVFILGTPFPYVDATAATGFASKRQRLMVGAAGMAVELFLAALAMMFWLNTEDGIMRSILFNIMLIGSVSTLFFNGNPLMRFDGYHLLCDALDQPNLAARAVLELRYLSKRYLFGLRDIYPAAGSNRESLGLASYGVAAFIYRLLVVLGIVIFVAKHFPAIGLLFALWIVVFQFSLPLAKHLHYLTVGKELAAQRRRALLVSASLMLTLVLAATLVPLPHSTHAEGVVWLPDSARLRALTSGEVVDVAAANNQTVEAGDPIVYLANVDTSAELLQKQAVLKEYRSRYEQAWSLDRAQLQLFEEDIAALQEEITYLQNQIDHLVVRSPATGVFKSLQKHALKGSFVHEGDTIGLLLNETPPTIRVALRQEEASFVRDKLKAIEVRLASEPARAIAGEIKQQVPGGTFALPSAALGTAGGGRIPVESEDGTRTRERVFLIDVALEAPLSQRFYGQRVYVNFRHPSESLLAKIKRSTQNLLLRIIRGEDRLTRNR